LIEKSHRPHYHPNEHTPEEKDMILRRFSRYKDDMIMLWDSLKKSGYTRFYTSVRVVNKWIKPEIKKKSSRKSMPYERASYPGQKVQIDVKFVPSTCVSNGQIYYQYTAVDECTQTPTLSLFENALMQLDIKYHRIRVATPRHNGKVERQHRTDQKRFYNKMKMYNLADGREQLESYNKKSKHSNKFTTALYFFGESVTYHLQLNNEH